MLCLPSLPILDVVPEELFYETNQELRLNGWLTLYKIDELVSNEI